MGRIGAAMKKAGLDAFVLLLIGVIVLARIWPQPGVGDGAWDLPALAGYGVSLIFFFYGLKLSPEKLRSGLRNWKLHIVVQLSTFLLFPLIVLGARALFMTPQTEPTWLSIYFLAALPSTVSSSVVMVSIAGGNIPAAIFNASISSLMGIFLTPVIMTLITSTSSGDMELGPIMGKLCLQVLLPVILGLLLNKRFGAFAEKHKTRLRQMDQTVILLIVYTAFCESFENGLFDGFGAMNIVIIGVSMVMLFFIAFYLITLICNLLGFNREDRITAVFCGSKKSLIHGTVMSKVLFAHTPDIIGLMLLPLMLYHALQIIFASAIAQRMGRNTAITAN
ncbi:bile acid:sodium symporter [Chitinophaga horti]|uniref:Bile acid:sodium symporter n=1 Tax=Chitinophaga horti TaxID=2920382 RepID=A0ABY6IVG2_9BACT|nr:bile acid:sodium symporter family protein [Chitinophaga horti]UYQ91368.1 bile acid:sodium symporter [Chitinophaga horti]